jgi:ADP-ribosylglycohydrolase
MNNHARNILFGVAVGDALGVPYEFSSREKMEEGPPVDMKGFMIHNQPAGTWSDDSSLTFCLAEAMISGYSLRSAAENFIKWKNEAYWTANNSVFDIGATTAAAINDLERILRRGEIADLERLRERADEYDNGNGSLMRILPLAFEIKGKDTGEQFEVVWKNSALTHRHIRAAMSCMIYLKFAEYLMRGIEKFEAYEKMIKDIRNLWQDSAYPVPEREHFKRIIDHRITRYEKKTIRSGGYVIESLEAALWCFLKSDDYEHAVKQAVTLGNDTDTTAAITGGLAGIYYSFDAIPRRWVEILSRSGDIEDLSDRLHHAY